MSLKEQPIEPMLRFNHSGYGVKIKDLITLGVFLFIGGGAYYLVDYKLNELHVLAKQNQVAITTSVANLSSLLQQEITKVEQIIKENRIERMEDIRDLQRRLAAEEARAARTTANIEALKEMILDIKELLNGRT